MGPLFTSKFSQGRRTFWFDVKKAKDDKAFLKVTSRSERAGVERKDAMTVFEDEIPEFCQSVMDAANFILSK
jgi:hypothetical protein